MKKLISILMFASIFIACNKDDNPKPTNPIDQLPPATQTGANTFGCLIDGEVFKPDNLPNSKNCFYQFLNGEYYFAVGASYLKDNILKGVVLKTEKKQIEEGVTYLLVENTSGNASANYTFNNNISTTNQFQTGELTITKLDNFNQIVSGTFWFDVKDNLGVVHQIREGRFDMQFTN